MNWKPAGNQYNPSARNGDNTIEVNGDLDASNPVHAGVYTLRDFVTTGDAIRIKLPFMNTDSEYQQWLWIENHAGIDINQNPFDQWQYQASNTNCIIGSTPGLAIYIQIDKDIRESDNAQSIYGGHAAYIRPLPANGLWDRDFSEQVVFNDCVSWSNTRPFERLLKNPFSGGGDQEFYSWDIDANGTIQMADQLDNWVENVGGQFHKNLFQLGHANHLFTINGNNYLNIGTNPSTVPLTNIVGRDNPDNSAKNVRKTYLNGVSIRIIEQNQNAIKIQVQFDDVDIDNNLRWCSDTIILNPIITPSGYSLNLKSNNSISLEQGLTATRMNNPYSFEGKQIFASPTFLKVKTGALLNIEEGSNFLLKDESKLRIESGAKFFVNNNAELRIKEGSTLIVDDCGVIEFRDYGKLIVEDGAILNISPNAVLFFANGFQNFEISPGAIILPGTINPEEAMFPYTQVNTNLLVNDGNYLMPEILNILEGGKLTILNSELIFANKLCKIRIQQGGELVVDNSYLKSSCGNNWQGIQVWGDKNESQQTLQGEPLLQGKLTLNNATIENAIIAIDLWKPDDWSSTGGIVYATDAVFRNNTKSVHALHYRNFNPYFPEIEWDYFSNFKNCTFEITADYLGDETFYKHVDLSHVKGIDFQGCDFSLAKNVAGVSTWNHAIAAYDASFGVSAICNSQQAPCPETDYDRSTFTGFWSAVSAVKDGYSTVTFSVNRADFINNAFGVRTTDMNNASVLLSNFEVGNYNGCGTGIYTDYVTGFAFEENNFSKFSGAAVSDYFGIIINNSEAVNEVYNNVFDGLSYANFSDGKNWRDIYRFEGLAYYCNENTNNYADFYVADYMPPKRSGIQSEQGNANYTAGNTFTQNGANWHFYNGGEHLVGYYYNQIENDEIPDDDKIYHVAKVGRSVTNNCNSHYGGDTELKIVLTPLQKVNAEQDYYDNLTHYNNVKSLYDSYVDGGDTEAEKLDIETAQPDDMWELRAQLLGDSPHLSLEVLKEAADKTDVFTESALFDILAANPDELKKDTLIRYLENKEEPLPAYMIDLLRQLAEGTTYKTALQQQMAGYKHAYTRAAHDIIRSNLNDTVADYVELRNWPDNLGGITSDKQIISSYIGEGNFTDALTLANMLPQLYNLSGIELTEHNYYMDMLYLHQTLSQEGRNTFQLDSIEKADLVFIATNSTGVAGAQAKSILEAVYNENYVRCPDEDGSAGYKSTTIINPNTLGKAYGLGISVKPNPAKQWAAFDYTLPGEETKATITITNATGSIIDVLVVNGQHGQKLWDSRGIKPGVYIYTIKTAGFSQSGKIVIGK